jgi:predicted transposase/invertase (TIGR01784 family)
VDDSQNTRENIDHDQLFKRLLELFFREFMDAFFPKASRAIDLEDITFLPVATYSDIPIGEKHEVDILAQTRLRGEPGLVLVHIEPQSYYQKDFAARMFRYFSYLYDKHRQRIVPIAVFSYDQVHSEPDNFNLGFDFLDVLRFRFYKLELKKLNWRKYIRGNNPAAAVLMSKMGYAENEKVQVKKEFVRMLARMKLDPVRSHFLMGFFEQYLRLNKREEELFRQEISKLNKEEIAMAMELTNSWEEKGREEGLTEGLAKGREKAALEMARKMLQSGMDVTTIVKITDLDRAKIEEIKKQLDHQQRAK